MPSRRAEWFFILSSCSATLELQVRLLYDWFRNSGGLLERSVAAISCAKVYVCSLECLELDREQVEHDDLMPHDA